MTIASHSAADPPAPLAPWLAADVQDDLLTAAHDLDRLERLLRDASDALLLNFRTAREGLDAEALTFCDGGPPKANMQIALNSLSQATVALQFQDMASQLIAHTCARLRHCADRLAAQAMDDDEEGPAVVEQAPLRPNPVTQDEMDAGSIELF